MKTIITDALQVIAAILLTTGVLVSAAPLPQNEASQSPQSVEKVAVAKEPITKPSKPASEPEIAKKDVSDPNGCEPEQYWAKEPPYECLPKPKTNPSVAPATTKSQPVSAGNNEAITWNFLIGQGFTRNQTAGIMGNLQQEHNFKTDDVPGGLGIAQWMGGRRANLIAQGNYLDINVQLNFMMSELNGPEAAAGRAIRAAQSVEGATVAFQNLFERCGMCHESQRINYAYSILSRY